MLAGLSGRPATSSVLPNSIAPIQIIILKITKGKKALLCVSRFLPLFSSSHSLLSFSFHVHVFLYGLFGLADSLRRLVRIGSMSCHVCRIYRGASFVSGDGHRFPNDHHYVRRSRRYKGQSW